MSRVQAVYILLGFFFDETIHEVVQVAESYAFSRSKVFTHFLRNSGGQDIEDQQSLPSNQRATSLSPLRGLTLLNVLCFPAAFGLIEFMGLVFKS